MKKISKIWFYMIVIGIVGSIYFGNLTELNTVIMSEGSRAIEFTISLAGNNEHCKGFRID